jgi:hypothetical protein
MLGYLKVNQIGCEVWGGDKDEVSTETKFFTRDVNYNFQVHSLNNNQPGRILIMMRGF